ncbi:hypothetical protein FisN_2Hh517 [Fistulifera solaris]|uniref:SET domain-containing protein n=1 Tax=Fistulifera solaris TaxID=1519565 RepID=A0A1Z5JGH7_FISSO|nr:hypothetical protein FisN_2Hh517 [Fistulifera solaris]|eukprot:GAX13036.1 hypothetical protein FisN_2Hh517 [Fistulifera solaris]
MRTNALPVFLSVISLISTPCGAWVLPSNRALRNQLRQTVSSTASDINTFERWCRDQGCTWNGAVSHAFFGRIRGLQWTGKARPTQPECVVSIPNTIVLSVEDNDTMWDAKLACKLWEEMQVGTRSSLSGYCSWLATANGESYVPNTVPSTTVPDALRHWTEEKKAILSAKPAGKKLVELQKKQEAAWREKYQPYSDVLSWEAFEWCMEVVHSRAFRGIGSSVSVIPAITAPLLAAFAGWYYVTVVNPLATTSKGDDTTLALLGVAGLLFASFPTVLQLLQKPMVALLPLIDSANHLETADSQIEYVPSKKTFDLVIGPQCIDNDTSQLYISYGKQSDEALLLNHGFLPNLQKRPGDTGSIRQSLIEAYHARNS